MATSINDTQYKTNPLSSHFERLKVATRNSSPTEYQARITHLTLLKNALLTYQKDLCDAIDQDYGHRAYYDTIWGDLLPCINQINYTIKHLKKWMKPSKRQAGLLLTPAKVTVCHQPLGVVGIVVPWNFPIMLSMGPLISALAAGNRAMIKLSEFTPNANTQIKRVITEIFSEEWVCVIEGDAQTAMNFTQLPFDHLLFTGSTEIGHHVMHAAADNLTPITLELGGKSPVIIADDMPIPTAVKRIIYGKSLNAGQICVAPDYVFLPENRVDEFVIEYQKQYKKCYPKGIESPDMTAIINQKQYQRLIDWRADAEAQGAIVVPCHEPAEDHQTRRLSTHLLLNTTDNMHVRQQEIFGPLLPIIGYQDLNEAMDYIKQRPHPLALYLMSFDPEIQQHIINNTTSGSVAINDTLVQIAADDAPFGGVGASGMGQYHGYEGFLTFSKAKTVLVRGKFSTGSLIQPPYGKWVQKLMLKFFLR